MKISTNLLLLFSFILLCLINSSVAEFEKTFGYLISIDLGSTNIVVNINSPQDTSFVKPLTDQEARIVIPSIVAFTNNGTLVGESARDQYVSNPTNTIMDVRRFLGRRFNDPIVQDAIQHSQLNIKETETGFLAIEVEINNVKKLVTPEEIAAVLFKEIKEWSKTIFTSKEDLLSAIVAIPYHYDDRQRDAIKNAATIAGLNIKLITRTSKAALNAYRIQGGDEPIYIVYHLGGNTLAATLFDCDIGVVEILEEIETRLGGSDFDQRVVDYFVEKYKETHGGNDISKNPLVLDKLRRQVEKAKIALSNSTLAHVEIHDPFFGDNNNNNTFHEILTREIFEQLNQDLFDRSIQYIDDLLLKANVTKQDIGGVVLTGGSLHIPKLSMLVEGYFKGKTIYNKIDPIDVVAYGSGVMDRSEFWEYYEVSISLLPLVDISLGVEASGGVMTKILTRNIALPVRRSLIFSTATDNQTSVKIRIFQGERILTMHNILVDEFNLTGIHPAPRGTALIEVTFEIGANEVLRVTAKDLHSGLSASIFPLVPNFSYDAANYYDRITIPLKRDKTKDVIIKEQITSQCITVDDPDLEEKLSKQVIWGLPDCKIMLLDPIEENNSHINKSNHDEL